MRASPLCSGTPNLGQIVENTRVFEGCMGTGRIFTTSCCIPGLRASHSIHIHDQKCNHVLCICTIVLRRTIIIIQTYGFARFLRLVVFIQFIAQYEISGTLGIRKQNMSVLTSACRNRHKNCLFCLSGKKVRTIHCNTQVVYARITTPQQNHGLDAKS